MASSSKSSLPSVPLKRLSVKYVGSGDELAQIVSSEDLSAKKPKISVQTFRKEEESDGVKKSHDEDEEGEDQVDIVEENESAKMASKALLGDGDVDGGQVYSFRTPKKKNGASLMAARSVERKKNPDVDEDRGSRSSRRVKQSAGKNTKYKQTRREQQNVSSSRKTPSRRNKDTSGDEKQKQIQNEAEIGSSSGRRRSTRLAVVRKKIDDHESSEESSESSSDGDDAESYLSDGSNHSGIVGAKKGTKEGKESTSTNKELDTASDGYFLAHSGGVVTSDHTLSRLAKPKMDQRELNSILKKAANSNQEEKDLLFEEYTEQFSKWMHQLSRGFNILLYGLGSKRHLLESFRSEYLTEFYHVVINGFFPSLTIRHILNAISEEVLESKKSGRGLLDQFAVIRSSLKTRQEPLFLIFHNVDGPTLRIKKNQHMLSSLAEIPCIHIIASIDHINAPLIWDQGLFSSFNWLWYDVTTYQDYTEETSYENSLLVQQSGALTLSSMTHVLKSVPPNVQGVFNILVEAQLEHKDDISYSGMSFQDLYQKCREAFYVSSDLTLRAQLTEFKDHKLLTFKKGIDGAELLSIPVDVSTLQEFKQQEDL